jgi:hypothetical protein
MADSVGRVRVTAGKVREGLLARGSKWGINRMDGICPSAAACASLDALLGSRVFRTLSAGAAVSALLRVIMGAGIDCSVVVTAGAGSDDGVSEDVDCWRMGVPLEAPFRPGTVGNQPLCTPGLAERVGVMESGAGAVPLSSRALLLRSSGWLLERGRAGRLLREELSLSERTCR